MRTRGCRFKPIGEILRFVGHQSFAEFHDAHRVRWYAVIGKYEFSDPEIAAADNSPDRKTLLVWLDESALLNVVPAADPPARFDHPSQSPTYASGYHFGTTEFIVLYAILKGGALLPIAPVVCRLTMRAIAVWFKNTPVGSPRNVRISSARGAKNFSPRFGQVA